MKVKLSYYAYYDNIIISSAILKWLVRQKTFFYKSCLYLRILSFFCYIWPILCIQNFWVAPHWPPLRTPLPKNCFHLWMSPIHFPNLPLCSDVVSQTVSQLHALDSIKKLITLYICRWNPVFCHRSWIYTFLFII